MNGRVRVSKACDACKARRVKCNGQANCQQCVHLGLKCLYTTAHRKPRMQGRRGRVIDEYRMSTASEQAILETKHRHNSSDTSASAVEPHTSALRILDATFLGDLLSDYEASVYPTHPIITPDAVRALIDDPDPSAEVQAFLFAYAAITLNLSSIGPRRTPDIVRTINRCLDEAVRSRGNPRPPIRASVIRALTSTFIHNCLVTRRDPDSAFYFLRDAITTIQLLRIDSKAAQAELDDGERRRRQRLHWLMFVQERFVAILDYRSVVLPPLPEEPEDDPTVPIGVQEGFKQIIKLFGLLDTDFLQNWLGSSGKSTVTPVWVEEKYKELEKGIAEDNESLRRLNAMQKIDLIVTRQWLQTIVWRMAMSQTLLSSTSSKDCLSLLFPVRLSQKLRHQLSNVSRESIEVHGTGIISKLFELSDTIADVVIHVPTATPSEVARSVDDFKFLIDFLYAFPALDTARRHVLDGKLRTLQEMFPHFFEHAGSFGLSPSRALPPLQEMFPNLFEAHAGDANIPSSPNTDPRGNPWYCITQSLIPKSISDLDSITSYPTH